MAKSYYAVYVSDPNGWDDGCPSSEDVFFGDHGGRFVRHSYELADDLDAKSDLGTQGFVIVEGYHAAVALRHRLNTTGDWISARTEAEERPSYAMHRLHGDGVTQPN